MRGVRPALPGRSMARFGRPRPDRRQVRRWAQGGRTAIQSGENRAKHWPGPVDNPGRSGALGGYPAFFPKTALDVWMGGRHIGLTSAAGLAPAGGLRRVRALGFTRVWIARQDGFGRLRRVWGGRFKNPLCGVPLKPTDRRVPDVRGLAGGSAEDPSLLRRGGFSRSLTIWMEEEKRGRPCPCVISKGVLRSLW